MSSDLPQTGMHTVKERIKHLRGRLREQINRYAILSNNITFIKYSIFGATGSLIDFTIFYSLAKIIGIQYLIANVISISIGTLNNFILNAFFNFRLKDRLLVRFVKYYCIGLGALGVSSLLLYIFIDLLGINVALSKIATIGIIILVQFNLNKTFSFKVYNDDDAQ